MFKKKPQPSPEDNTKGTQNDNGDTKEENDFYSSIRERISEMLRRAAMSEEERAAEDKQRDFSELEEQRQACSRERQEFIAAKLLFENGLPERLSSMAAGEDDEKTRERVELLKALFSEELEKAVGEQLKGKTPSVPPQKSSTDPFLTGFRL